MWRLTLVGALLGVGAQGGYHALMTWWPMYLQTERPLSVLSRGEYLAVIIFAFWCGCLARAQRLDRIGRRKNILRFAVCCVVTVVGYLFLPLMNAQMRVLGFPAGFLPREFRRVWGRFSTSSIRPGCAGPGWVFAAVSGASRRLDFPGWSGA
jgi:nitrate/nitrite transporter NarK